MRWSLPCYAVHTLMRVSTQSFHNNPPAFRRVFQLPALPKHEPKLQTWQRPTAPTLSIQYPPPLAQASDPSAQLQLLHQHQQGIPPQLAEASVPEASPEPMDDASAEVGDAAAETLETQEEEETELSLARSAQIASLQQHPAAQMAAAEVVAPEAGKAPGAAASEAADAGRGLVEEPFYHSARGLKPRPAARALAGPTVHILLEGYVSHSASHLHMDCVLKHV